MTEQNEARPPDGQDQQRRSSGGGGDRPDLDARQGRMSEHRTPIGWNI